jgi:hypothetical protein
MAARASSGLHPLKVHGEVAKRDVSHLHDEAPCLREPRLLERHFTSEGGLNREAFEAFYPFPNEAFEFAVYSSPYLIRDPMYEPPLSSAARSSALKQAIPKLETGYRVDLPLPGGPATTTMRGVISRRSRDPYLPACPQANPSEFGDRGYRECRAPGDRQQRPCHVSRQQRDAGLQCGFDSSCQEAESSSSPSFYLRCVNLGLGPILWIKDVCGQNVRSSMNLVTFRLNVTRCNRAPLT